RGEQGAGLEEGVRRLVPGRAAENLTCARAVFSSARRFEDVIAVASRVPQNARGLGIRLMLTLSYALLGRKQEADRARTELLTNYPWVSAELLLSQDWRMAAAQEALFCEGFRVAALPLRAAEAAQPFRVAER